MQSNLEQGLSTLLGIRSPSTACELFSNIARSLKEVRGRPRTLRPVATLPTAEYKERSVHPDETLGSDGESSLSSVILIAN